MNVSVHLHGLLREVLPLEAKGQTTLNLPDGATVADLITHFGFQRRVVAAVNDEIEVAPDHPLHDGDDVALFTVMAGG